VLANEKPFGPGDNRLTWDGRNDKGSPAASGVYFIRPDTRVGIKVARAALLK
jgi:flagellar hook assembly protein FlgD